MFRKIILLLISLSIVPTTIFASSKFVSVEHFDKLDNVFKHSQYAQKIYYNMPSTKGGEIKSSAVLITPKRTEKNKKSGLVVLTYGTVGIASQCAPVWNVKSNDTPDFLNIPNYWDSASYDTIDYYLHNGLYVLAVNKEGQANSDFDITSTYGEPYGNKYSMVNSIDYALLAASHILGDKFSGDWAITGHSQGGQTVFAVAEQKISSQKQEHKFNFLGGVALSPAINISEVFFQHEKSILKLSNSMNINEGDGEMNRVTVLSINLLRAMLESGFKPNIKNIIGGNIYKKFMEITNDHCVGKQMSIINDDISRWRFLHSDESIMNYDGFNIDSFMNDSEVKRAMQEWSVEKLTLNGRILVMAGDRDEFVPFQSIVDSIRKMQSHGNSIDFLRVKNADHQGYLRLKSTKKIIQDYIMKLFNE